MNKNIEIIEKLSICIFVDSRIPCNEPVYRHFDKIPKNIKESLKSVKSDDLKLVRIDYVFPKNNNEKS